MNRTDDIGGGDRPSPRDGMSVVEVTGPQDAHRHDAHRQDAHRQSAHRQDAHPRDAHPRDAAASYGGASSYDVSAIHSPPPGSGPYDGGPHDGAARHRPPYGNHSRDARPQGWSVGGPDDAIEVGGPEGFDDSPPWAQRQHQTPGSPPAVDPGRQIWAGDPPPAAVPVDPWRGGADPAPSYGRERPGSWQQTRGDRPAAPMPPVPPPTEAMRPPPPPTEAMRPPPPPTEAMSLGPATEAMPLPPPTGGLPLGSLPGPPAPGIDTWPSIRPAFRDPTPPPPPAEQPPRPGHVIDGVATRTFDPIHDRFPPAPGTASRPGPTPVETTGEYRPSTLYPAPPPPPGATGASPIPRTDPQTSGRVASWLRDPVGPPALPPARPQSAPPASPPGPAGTGPGLYHDGAPDQAGRGWGHGFHSGPAYGAEIHGSEIHGSEIDSAGMRGVDVRSAEMHAAEMHGIEMRHGPMPGDRVDADDVHDRSWPREQTWPPDEYGPRGDPRYDDPRSGTGLPPAALLPASPDTASRGWRRLVYQVSAGALNPGPSPDEARYRRLLARIRTPLDDCHRIAVLSLKGGVGKTTTTVSLGSTLASLRGDRVVAIDANPDRGTLGVRVERTTRHTVRDLLADADQLHRYVDVRRYLSQSASRLEVLASASDPEISDAFADEDYRAVDDLLQRHYSILLTDCGTGMLHSAMHGVLELADTLVIVSNASADGGASASATLDWLDAHGYNDHVSEAVTVISMFPQQGETVDVDALEDHFASRTRQVVRVPFDPHLASGGHIVLDELRRETRRAYEEIAGAVAERFG
ncbi:AAA family ATPase [Frankia sp. Mgl5]|uniref:MinD/ParA family ATP-binding protein n=1 Tax=Frankia sp. Mgl5 TaxID=2933793 RepID=UPI00200BD4F4|nr:MinD/ParA family protein [Frankia sp. Mgl5]MCK9932989.1 AAA family ATPase [Frankia sp. Mgl5]